MGKRGDRDRINYTVMRYMNDNMSSQPKRKGGWCAPVALILAAVPLSAIYLIVDFLA